MKIHLHRLLGLSLSLFSLYAPAQILETNTFMGLNLMIPDGNWSGLSYKYTNTSSIARLDSLRVKLNVTGEYNGDLYCYLRHATPMVTNFCVLLNRPGRSAIDPHGYPDMGLDVYFDASVGTNANIHNYRAITNPPYGTPLTGSWQPDGRRIDPGAVADATPVETYLSSFYGVEASGIWTLFLADVDLGGTNMLVGCQFEMAGGMAPAITWPPLAEIVYGTPLGASQLNASAGPVPGTFAYQPAIESILPAGTHTLQAVFSPNDPVNYIAATTSVSLVVLRKDLRIRALDAAKIYDGLAFHGDNGATYDGLVNGETPDVLEGTLAFAGDSQGAITAGSYLIVPSGLSNPNYSIMFSNGVLTVNPAELQIKANDVTKLYDAVPFVGGTASYAGFVNGESTSVLGGALVYGGSSQGATNAGSYSITVTGLTSLNYTLLFREGTLTIGKAATEAGLTASQNPVKPRDPVTFTVGLQAVAPGAGIPSGSVQFMTNGAPTGESAILTGGVASLTTSNLAVGLYEIRAQYLGDHNFLGTEVALSNLLVNTQPVAQPDTIVRYRTNDVKVAIATLLKNDLDADSDTLAFVGFSAISTNNGTIVREGNWLNYVPPQGSTNGDLFTYTISDGRGTPVTADVFVQVVTDLLPPPNLTIVSQGDGSYLLRFDGIPGLQYRIEYCEDLDARNWITLAAITADSVGVFYFLDTPPKGSPTRYYRSAFP